MKIIPLSDKETSEVRKAVDVPPGAQVVLMYENPRAPVMLIDEIWDNAGDERPRTRYIYPRPPKALWFVDAVKLAELLDGPANRITIAPKDDAYRVAYDAEQVNPSTEFLATGVIRYTTT